MATCCCALDVSELERPGDTSVDGEGVRVGRREGGVMVMPPTSCCRIAANDSVRKDKSASPSCRQHGPCMQLPMGVSTRATSAATAMHSGVRTAGRLPRTAVV